VGEAQSDRAERVNNCRKIPAYLLKVGHYTQLFDSLSLTIFGVESQLKQVFLNLVLNAVEAMPHGGELLIHGCLLDDHGKWVAIAFMDSGVGIPPDDLDKIFEPFYTSKANGTGLGLTVSHNIIANHGGRLTAESVVGKGSSFTVWLPVPSD
jgi:signal transduction histidine kinase